MKLITAWLNQKPRYIHDCKKCKFLGTFREFDLYACGEEVDVEKIEVETLIARRSSEPSDYSSGAEFAFTETPAERKDNPLVQAMARVVYRRGCFEIPDRIKAAAWRHIIEPMFAEIAQE